MGMISNENDYLLYAVFLPTITYASQAWWGFVSAADKHRLSSLVHNTRCNLDGGVSLPELDAVCLKLDRALFSSVLADEYHVLHQLLSRPITYSSDPITERFLYALLSQPKTL
jgi:hypothetical protein